MKIRTVYLKDVGPIRTKTIDLRDTWKGGLHTFVLVSGPNGCGKSTVLRGIAHLWQMLGQWLSVPGAKGRTQSVARKWLEKCGAFGVILDDVYGITGPLGVFFGDEASLNDLRTQSTDVLQWIGETTRYTGKPGKPPRHRLGDGVQGSAGLAEAYKKLVLGGEPNGTPNVIHLDGEDRRWVRPTVGTGDVVADDPAMRWLASYRATNDWKGQLEASLIAMKTINPERYYGVIDDLNGFLAGKRIMPEPDESTLRLRVEAGDSEHGLDELSAGEHQVMIQLYMVSRFMQPGGVVLIDEPDLHLHPSLVGPFLSKLEAVVAKKSGQLILTSHMPAIWERYEARGHREKLGGEL